MRTLRYVALGLIPLGVGLWAQTPKTSEQASFSITLSVPQSIVKAGSETELDVRLKNITTHDIGVGEILGGAELNYDIQVRDVGGRLARETPLGKKLHGKDPTYQGEHGSVVTRTLSPGSDYETKTFLNKIYALNEPGAYSVQASRRDPGSGFVVKSNTITVTVTP